MQRISYHFKTLPDVTTTKVDDERCVYESVDDERPVYESVDDELCVHETVDDNVVAIMLSRCLWWTMDEENLETFMVSLL